MAKPLSASEFIASLGLSDNQRSIMARTAQEYESTGKWVDFDTLTYEAEEAGTTVDLNEALRLPGVLAFKGTGETVELTGLGLLVAGSAPRTSETLARLAKICGERKLSLKGEARIGQSILIDEYGFSLKMPQVAFS